MDINNIIKDISEHTPDPDRSFKNLNRFFQNSPEFLEKYINEIGNIAQLFAYSQFLGDFTIKDPTPLAIAIENLKIPINKQDILSELSSVERNDRQSAMKHIREIKKRCLLRITLRDITGTMDLSQCMRELSILAEAIIEAVLNVSVSLMKEKFGDIENNPFSIIALGKLGAGDLNYSSDIDLLSVYHHDEGLSSGLLLPSGVRTKRIEPHEYFCKLTETVVNLLHTQTEDGIGYRVDLRLRPNGQKGDLSLSLNSYVSYYESWGKTWERMTLIRARPVAGDMQLGEMFTRGVEPFVWKRSIDYSDIEEIKGLKKKIDTIFDVNDIKRGYGGIREIEFFVQTFQLLYGGELRNLRTGFLSNALNELHKEGFLSAGDIKILSESYIFLRRLEHVLQMKDDLQTHTIPSNQPELEFCARKMRFKTGKEFTSELRLKRLMVRDMYNSLFGSADAQSEVTVFFEEDLPDSIIRDYLSFRGFRNPEFSLKNIRALSEHASVGKTMRERSLLKKVINSFMDQILRSENKDRVLSMLTTFIEKIGMHESYLDLLSKRGDTREILVNTFVKSTYLTRSILSLDNLEGLFEYPDIRMDYKFVRERLLNILEYNPNPMNAIREFRIIEELKTGLLFLKGSFDVYSLSNTLSMIADTILRSLLRHLNADKDIGVVALGKFGSRELNIGSDLDLIFISAGREESTHLAEEFLKFITEYTSRGIVYRIDMRLRPDGSKGILVNDIDGYKNYYMQSAHRWEIQALLKARPVAGHSNIMREFYNLKKQIITERGKEITASDIKDMRKRILSELSKDTIGYDIKIGRGGRGEIEFLIEYLQLKHADRFQDLIVHNTMLATKRLVRHGILQDATGEFLQSAYRFMRTIETFLRLNEEDALKPDSELTDIIFKFMGMDSRERLIKQIEITRNKVLDITQHFYE
ncbi:MAG: bifunctional [glutamate--ammonia ligase]-adenylyl-L-tyrosine phosphorylase/[glutamate--ammonia-ligase] adenylyltransferase [Nitrospirae bacterium]|nr:bifunctional [glutamate--ammonia ligase]-adenylyl-L-tyrosine phosphorylase/[glutamate--ammonia-ligase] adenylyltransferase [Nitrospirota bacterium]